MSDVLVQTYAHAQAFLEELFDEAINEVITEGQFAFQEVFDVGPFKRAVYKSLDGAGPGLPQRREMMEPVAPGGWEEGDMFTAREYNWGLQTVIPVELIRKFAKFGDGDPDVAALIASEANFMKAMKYNSVRRADIESVNVLLNGDSTTAPYAGRRGEALFGTHTMLGNPGTSQTNITVNLSLTEPNLFMVINAIDNQKDHNGAKGPDGTGYTLVTGSALRSRGWTIMNTEKQTDSANNNKNIIYSMKSKIKHIVWKEIDTVFGADFTGWFVFKDGYNGLKFRWMEKPYFQKESDVNVNALRYTVNSSGRAFWDTWLGSYASLPS